MSESLSNDTFSQMIDGLDRFVTSKTVVGEPIRAEGAVIIPLIDVSSGMAIGSFNKEAGSGAGGMYSKMTPTAVLIIQHGSVRLINMKNTDAVSKVLDMIPSLIDSITGKNQISEKAEKAAEAVATSLKPYKE